MPGIAIVFAQAIRIRRRHGADAASHHSFKPDLRWIQSVPNLLGIALRSALKPHRIVASVMRLRYASARSSPCGAAD